MFSAGMERLLKTNERLNKQTVSVDLRTLSDSLIDREEELEQREARIEELETVLWEGRFTDYIARGLAKVKSSQAWQQPENLSRGNNWATIVQKLATEDPNTGVEKYLKAASKELGISFRTIKAWATLYASRCSSKYHHAGFDSLFHLGNTDGMAEQILTDLDEVYTHTPKHLESSIPVVYAAITDFKDSIFKKCTWKGNELTPHGKKMFKGEQ